MSAGEIARDIIREAAPIIVALIALWRSERAIIRSRAALAHSRQTRHINGNPPAQSEEEEEANG